MANREDLIRDLYSNMIGDDKPVNQERSRYHADTRTLTNGTEINLKESSHRYEIPLETHEYAAVMMGNRNYFLTKDQGFLINDVIAFREMNGLQYTGNASLRTIALVEKEVKGLTEGYCIVSW